MKERSEEKRGTTEPIGVVREAGILAAAVLLPSYRALAAGVRAGGREAGHLSRPGDGRHSKLKGFCVHALDAPQVTHERPRLVDL